MRALLLLLAMGCAQPVNDAEPASEAIVYGEPISGSQRTTVVRDHTGEVAQYLKRLEQIELRLQDNPSLIQANTDKAQLLFNLARLRGGSQDLLAAEAALKLAAVQGADLPKVRRAQATLLQKSHRFSEALALVDDLDSPGDQALKASIRFELGDYEASIATLQALVENERFPDPGLSSRLAVCLWKMGRFDEAEHWAQSAQDNYHGRENWVVSWQHLVLGLMDLDRQQYDQALRHYQDADQALPGWWLVQEHMAEIHLLQGHPELALPVYRNVVAETQSPELMAALADTLDALDRPDEGSTWRTKALAGFEAQLAQNASSAGGHALQFFLHHGDPERTLALAKMNHDLRPNGEAKNLLAHAYEATGQHGKADALHKEVQDSGWWTPGAR